MLVVALTASHHHIRVDQPREHSRARNGFRDNLPGWNHFDIVRGQLRAGGDSVDVLKL